MPQDVSGGLRLPHVNELHPDVATFAIARTLEEVYRSVIEEPVPPRLMAILLRMESRGGRDGG
ncbi:hypothetical protein [Microvirga sp. M2]|uniref:hypothetical protein n=1 Tax=Microvirga sp. M2 TaxID=3073270 RepID=UPI0039C3CBF5